MQKIILSKDKLSFLSSQGLKFDIIECGEFFATIEIKEINALVLLQFFRAGMLYSEQNR
jgi:hypothetical protein